MEVALTVQFEAIDRLRSAHIGSLWERLFRHEYPHIEEHGPIAEILELESPALRPSSPPFRLLIEPSVRRFFFLNSSRDEFLQVQANRISYNWRRLSDEYHYPRYPSLREKLLGAIEKVTSFLEVEQLGKLEPNQCEIVYVNHIQFETGPGAHRHLGQFMKLWSRSYSALAGAPLEDAALQIRHAIRGERDEFLGRLAVSVQPAYLVSDQTPIYKVEFFARGRPVDNGTLGAFRFLDLGHERVVAAFAEFMTDSVQQGWRSGVES